jgi:hypothetical protein
MGLSNTLILCFLKIILYIKNMKVLYLTGMLLYSILTFIGSMFRAYLTFVLSYVVRALLYVLPFYYCYNFVAFKCGLIRMDMFTCFVLNMLLALVFNNPSGLVKFKVKK